MHVAPAQAERPSGVMRGGGGGEWNWGWLRDSWDCASRWTGLAHRMHSRHSPTSPSDDPVRFFTSGFFANEEADRPKGHYIDAVPATIVVSSSVKILRKAKLEPAPQGRKQFETLEGTGGRCGKEKRGAREMAGVRAGREVGEQLLEGRGVGGGAS